MSELIELIKQLRERTGAGMMDCKKALLANNNDVEASITWLREKGIAKQAKKASTRIAAEGVASLMIDGNRAAIRSQLRNRLRRQLRSVPCSRQGSQRDRSQEQSEDFRGSQSLQERKGSVDCGPLRRCDRQDGRKDGFPPFRNRR